ncbi:hypothetical protein CCMA1212_006245 [Trichoderma ghanense]|uniref:Uncharacterized protein n=1 Tax=Trichoderma ghanense TaxID=65468 RepID=A0ABY2GZR7_9HYPO
MAEIEMDVDLAPSMKFDEHADDDLIDYDIDTTEDHNDPWPAHHDDPMSNAPEHVNSTEEHVGIESKSTEAEYDGRIQDADAERFQVNLARFRFPDDTVDEAQQQSKAAVTVYEEEILTIEEEQPKNAPVTETENTADEIDYEDNDVTVTHESSHEADEEEDHVHDVAAADDVATVEPSTAQPSMADPSGLSQPTEQPAGDAEVPEASAQDDEDEITWEHEYDEKGAVSGVVEAAAEVAVETAAETAVETVVETAAESTTQEAVPQNHAESQSSDSHEHVYEQRTNAAESDYEDTAKDASAEQESVDHEEDDSRSQPEESSPGGEHEFPAITVHYKGNEYSFFSHKKTEGFFSDVSVLDQPMESLLAGFRAELEDEIAAHDELVFQVDELGLEFAEATIQSSLASITLRQVLEVFDLLVKNQDPDSSRTLYTYLFTKPNPSKRFEFLAESAAASKGLDEVIYLFESPAGHPHQTAVEGDDGDEYEHDEDSEANEASEAHESAEDGDEHGDADADTEESQVSEEDEGEEETSAVEEQPAEAADQDEEAEEDEEVEEGEEDDEDDAEDFMEDVEEDFNGDVEETANQDEGDYSDSGDGGYRHEQLKAVVVEAAGHSDPSHANADAEEAPDATYSYGKTIHGKTFDSSGANEPPLDDAEEDADANPFIHLELQESAGDNGGEIQFEQTVQVEAGDKASHEVPMQSIDEHMDANEADTGTTNTLADNGEGISTLLDMGTVQDLEQEITNEDLAFEDEMPEIDWRDDLEVAQDASNELPTTTPGLPKRRRTEEEQGEEDEQALDTSPTGEACPSNVTEY